MKFSYATTATLFCCLLFTTTASADQIIFDYTATLERISGTTDPLGLIGAEFTFRATFDADDIYYADGGAATVTALSHMWTISGSTSGDGNYSDGDGVVWQPNSVGGRFRDATGLNLASNDSNPIFAGANSFQNSSLLGLAGSGTAPTLGDQVQLGDFASGAITAHTIAFVDGDSNVFRNDTGSTFVTITAIPEPGSLSLLGLAVLGCATRRLRRRKS